MYSDPEQRREAVDVTRQELLVRLDRYLPEPDYREFFAWALSADNPDRALFTRIIALTQLGNLTGELLAGLSGADEWPALLRHAVPVNLYQIFEVVSDNLGIGLAEPGARPEARALLRDFDAVAAGDLRHPSTRPVAGLLAPLRSRCDRVSGFAQSLTAEYQRKIRDRYLADRAPAVAPDALEYSVWSGLVANLESGRDVLAALAGTAGEAAVRAATIERYTAVDRTVLGLDRSREELLDTGSKAILVTATLAYFATVFGELSGADPGYPAALDDGSLVAAFETAAALVRLQNDIGTPLLRMTRADRSDLFESLRDGRASNPLSTLRAAANEPALNRFRKDLEHGEFNICLGMMRTADDPGEGLRVLIDDLDYFAERYARLRRELDRQLTALDRRLRDRRGIELTRRFVDFHERLYSHRYDTLDGDYAI
ncbi:hypothetical protein BJY24_004263 [Nocardia transvalensis]|uniref:Uncharacterized protein n=1 Tax=Nocardia transvalensis TaxID=37333 RepID=A0A7W9PG21_9NOCA|nr:hypothetical protein [Nocardia transvalensis]MBB5915351.1 hypothetical protein [Nocardia transvalensis]